MEGLPISDTMQAMLLALISRYDYSFAGAMHCLHLTKQGAMFIDSGPNNPAGLTLTRQPSIRAPHVLWLDCFLQGRQPHTVERAAAKAWLVVPRQLWRHSQNKH